VPTTGPRFGVPTGSRVVVIVQEVCPGCLSCLGHPVRVLGRSTRAVSSVRYLVRPSSVRVCDVHASAVQCPGVDVRCPASVSARSASTSRCVRTGELVELVGAAGSRMVRRGVWIWPSCRIRERLDHLPEPAWLRVRDCLASHRTGSSGWGGDYAPWSLCEAWGRVAWSLRAFPAGLRLALAAAARPQHALSAARSKLTTL
jgi:hypothetical protein